MEGILEMQLSKLVKEQLEQDSILYSASFFNYFEIQTYYQNESKFDVVHWRNNLANPNDW